MILQAGRFNFNLSSPVIMGILNVTPDSFSDGGKFNNVNTALRHTEFMLNSGAEIIDIGAESTRPNANSIDKKEELNRLLPIIKAITLRFDCCLSIDTNKPDVMKEVLAYDIGMINNVKGFTDDSSFEIVANSNAALCIMHMKGNPKTMQKETVYGNLCQDIMFFFDEQVSKAKQKGISDDRIVVDPGFGFGKSVQQNTELVKNLSFFAKKYPVLMGLSRKSTLGHLIGDLNENRLIPSVVAALLSICHGASILRVHDVKETADALKIYQATK